MTIGDYFRRQIGRGVQSTTHLYLMPRLRMSGASTLLPLYAFLACTRDNFTFNFIKGVVWWSEAWTG